MEGRCAPLDQCQIQWGSVKSKPFFVCVCAFFLEISLKIRYPELMVSHHIPYENCKAFLDTPSWRLRL